MKDGLIIYISTNFSLRSIKSMQLQKLQNISNKRLLSFFRFLYTYMPNPPVMAYYKMIKTGSFKWGENITDINTMHRKSLPCIVLMLLILDLFITDK